MASMRAVWDRNRAAEERRGALQAEVKVSPR
jgi:hypothetical protein